jgi:2-amino-4-hydroxy-6-hydroxymethyldihydropteridine diphosphokinase
MFVPDMNTANAIFLLLGTNLGDRRSNLNHAIHEISRVTTIHKTSSIYETDAWGKSDQPSFYNQVLQVTSSLNADDLLSHVLSFEQILGRKRLEKWGPRVIDIDILFYGSAIINTTSLTVPHPGIPHRRFVLAPLLEIAPHFVHPVFNKTIQVLLSECTDQLSVQQLKN